MRAKAVETRYFELIAQTLCAGGDIEMPCGHASQRARAGGRCPARRVRSGVGNQNFRRADPFERRGHLIRCDFREPQRAARKIQPREADARRDAATVVRDAHGEQKDIAFVRQQRGVR